MRPAVLDNVHPRGLRGPAELVKLPNKPGVQLPKLLLHVGGHCTAGGGGECSIGIGRRLGRSVDVAQSGKRVRRLRGCVADLFEAALDRPEVGDAPGIGRPEVKVVVAHCAAVHDLGKPGLVFALRHHGFFDQLLGAVQVGTIRGLEESGQRQWRRAWVRVGLTLWGWVTPDPDTARTAATARERRETDQGTCWVPVAAGLPLI